MSIKTKIGSMPVIYFLKRYPKQFVFYSFLFIIESILEVIGLSLFGPIISQIGNLNTQIGSSPGILKTIFSIINPHNNLKVFLICICLAFFFKSIFQYFLKWKVCKLSARYFLEILEEFSFSFEKTSKLELIGINRSQILNFINEHSKKTSTLMIWCLLLCSGIITSLFFVIILFTISFELTLICILAFCVFFAISKVLLFYSKTIGLENASLSEQLSKATITGLEQINFARVVGEEDFIMSKLRMVAVGFSKNWIKYQFSSNVISILFNPFIAIVFTIVILQSQELDISVSALITFLVILQRLLPGYSNVQGLQSNIALSQKSLEITNQILERYKNLIEVEGLNPAPVFSSSIRFESVCFSYQKNVIFENINVVLKRGAKYAIVGPSGVGKSTFINLLVGLYKPSSGKVFLDDEDMSSINRNELRQQVSFVPQGTKLLDESIFSNITYSKSTFESDRVFLAMRLSELAEFYDVVHDFSVDQMSEGQKQRCFLSRYFYADRAISILDEPTSALDKKTESKVIMNIMGTSQDKTIILVTHNPDLISYVDKVLVIENKKIIEVDKVCYLEKLQNA